MKRTQQHLPKGPGIAGSWGRKTATKKECCYCGLQIPIKNITREHIIPKHKGGRITAPCCKKCNSEKGGLDLLDYAIWLTNELKKLKNNIKFYREIKICHRKIKNCIIYLKLLNPELYDIL